jgi:hypothetical protein
METTTKEQIMIEHIPTTPVVSTSRKVLRRVIKTAVAVAAVGAGAAVIASRKTETTPEA